MKRVARMIVRVPRRCLVVYSSSSPPSCILHSHHLVQVGGRSPCFLLLSVLCVYFVLCLHQYFFPCSSPITLGSTLLLIVFISAMSSESSASPVMFEASGEVTASPPGKRTRTVAMIKFHALDHRFEIERRILEAGFEVRGHSTSLCVPKQAHTSRLQRRSSKRGRWSSILRPTQRPCSSFSAQSTSRLASECQPLMR